MNQVVKENNTEIEIDLQRVLAAVWQKIWAVILVAVICGAAAFGYTRLMVTPLYQSAAMFYVNNNSFSVGDASLSISSGDLVTSRNLVDSYIVILNTRGTLNDVIDYADLEMSYAELKGMLSASAVNETEIFRVTVTSPDPNQAESIANAIANILPKRIATIIDGTSAKIVDHAVVPAGPSSPNVMKNTMIGALLGMLCVLGMIVLREIFNIAIRTEEDISQASGHPILAAVPDMMAGGKESSYYRGYGYGERKKKDKTDRPAVQAAKQGSAINMIGSNASFMAGEAYKLLRTKLQFAFADDNNCRVIGLSSALSGEGKSLTATNLAYTLAQLNKKVILLDCDMRRPTLAEKMGIEKKPGLSDYLSAQKSRDQVIQNFSMNNGDVEFNVISAGENPPNPVELLSSARMDRLLNALREKYDYVILDLPPVNEVTDALAVAPKTDGMLLVVRQNYCDRVVLGETAKQFAFINARVLGIVFNCTVEHSGKYGKGYYKKYYRRRYYYKRYAYNSDRK